MSCVLCVNVSQGAGTEIALSCHINGDWITLPCLRSFFFSRLIVLHGFLLYFKNTCLKLEAVVALSL